MFPLVSWGFPVYFVPQQARNPRLQAQGERVPVDIICVLDISGSMSMEAAEVVPVDVHRGDSLPKDGIDYIDDMYRGDFSWGYTSNDIGSW